MEDGLNEALEAAKKVLYSGINNYTRWDVSLAKAYGLIEMETETDNDRSWWFPTAKLEELAEV